MVYSVINKVSVCSQNQPNDFLINVDCPVVAEVGTLVTLISETNS